MAESSCPLPQVVNALQQGNLDPFGSLEPNLPDILKGISAFFKFRRAASREQMQLKSIRFFSVRRQTDFQTGLAPLPGVAHPWPPYVDAREFS